MSAADGWPLGGYAFVNWGNSITAKARRREERLVLFASSRLCGMQFRFGSSASLCRSCELYVLLSLQVS